MKTAVDSSVLFDIVKGAPGAAAAQAALEAALNRALALSPHSKAALAQLEDCVFALHCTAPRCVASRCVALPEPCAKSHCFGSA